MQPIPGLWAVFSGRGSRSEGGLPTGAASSREFLTTFLYRPFIITLDYILQETPNLLGQEVGKPNKHRDDRHAGAWHPICRLALWPALDSGTAGPDTFKAAERVRGAGYGARTRLIWGKSATDESGLLHGELLTPSSVCIVVETPEYRLLIRGTVRGDSSAAV